MTPTDIGIVTSALEYNALSSLLFLTSVVVTILNLPVTYIVNEPWPADSNLKDGTAFDFIIVGGGTAGCVLAYRLTEIFSWNVLVIEAGGDPPILSMIPGLAGVQYYSPWDWGYSSQNDEYSSQALLSKSIRIPRGKMLGGCSSINIMFYTHGNPADYNAWENAGNPGWGWETALKYFKKSQNIDVEAIENDPIDSAYFGKNGPYHTTRFNYSTAINENIMTIYQQAGFRLLNTYDGPSQMGAALDLGSVNKGKRESTARAYLIPAAVRPNLYLLKNSLVVKILIDKKKRAYGVLVRRNTGVYYTFYSKKEVIVSAGTINTPQLLKLSGIGPKKELDYFGIPVVKNLKVGENYQDHSTIPIYFFGNPNATRTEPMGALLTSYIQYLLTGKGSLSTNLAPEPLLFFNTDPEKTYPTFEVFEVFSPLGSVVAPGVGMGFNNVNIDVAMQLLALGQQFESYLFTAVIQHPRSRGRVQLRSKDPSDPPIIWTGIFRDQQDIEDTVTAIKRVMSFAETPFMKERGFFIPRLNIPTCKEYPDIYSDEYIRCYVINMAATIYHHIGTSKMAPPTDPYAVVNNNLKVYGVKDLRVIDASIMPTHMSGHTCAPTVMVAERAADLIKEDYGVFIEDNDVEKYPDEVII